MKYKLCTSKIQYTTYFQKDFLMPETVNPGEELKFSYRDQVMLLVAAFSSKFHNYSLMDFPTWECEVWGSTVGFWSEPGGNNVWWWW